MTDPNSYLNQLRAFMQFYDQNGPQVPTYQGGMFGDNGAAQNQATQQDNRLNFAIRAAQAVNGPQGFPGMQPAPNFFAGLPNQPQPAAPLPQSMIPQSSLPQVPPANLLAFQFRH